MSENGAEPRHLDAIDYPKIEIPGRGTFVVKFGPAAAVVLERQVKMDMAEIGRRMLEWMPHQSESGEEIPGRVSPAFLFEVLSACLWTKLHLPAIELAELFEDDWNSLPEVARVVATAFSKAQWPARMRLQEPSTNTAQEPPALPN